MDEDSKELDSTVIFKQEASQLTSVQNLEDALSRYGFAKDDRISHRELVLIYIHIKTAMETEIFRLANSSAYAEAKEMRARLTNLRKEFDDLQINGVEKVRRQQTEIFEKASTELTQKLKAEHAVSLDDVEKYIQEKWEENQLFRDIENDNLEQAISKIPRPNMRYSKRLIELFKSEYNLNKLKQYDEAMKVRRMIDKILPMEQEKFYKHFDESIERMRLRLATNQKIDHDRLEEKMKKYEWTEYRRREKEMKINRQRIQNNLHDMTHAHKMEAKLQPEMSVKQSALWQKRNGYHATSSSLRGQQLYDHVRGKQVGQHVYAESLVKRHDFDDIPMDTITYHETKH